MLFCHFHVVTADIAVIISANMVDLTAYYHGTCLFLKLSNFMFLKITVKKSFLKRSHAF